jgi:hypothetical protein
LTIENTEKGQHKPSIVDLDSHDPIVSFWDLISVKIRVRIQFRDVYTAEKGFGSSQDFQVLHKNKEVP